MTNGYGSVPHKLLIEAMAIFYILEKILFLLRNYYSNFQVRFMAETFTLMTEAGFMIMFICIHYWLHFISTFCTLHLPTLQLLHNSMLSETAVGLKYYTFSIYLSLFLYTCVFIWWIFSVFVSPRIEVFTSGYLCMYILYTIPKHAYLCHCLQINSFGFLLYPLFIPWLSPW